MSAPEPPRRAEDFGWHCPLPVDPDDRIQMAHGAGGRLMNELIDRLIRPSLAGGEAAARDARHDAAWLSVPGDNWAMSTDTFVVRPLFFPGGDIGRLAVYGTVNDLWMAGARPQFLSCGLILEEGLPLPVLARILTSMGQAAAECGVRIVTGDTKVVERGHGDGLYINTTGIGQTLAAGPFCPSRIVPGDRLLVSGDLGRHSIAVMAAREGLRFETDLVSDAAPLGGPVEAWLEAGIVPHCLRDLTRGGLASGLCELAEAAGCDFEIDEAALPIDGAVQGACEILGLDPWSLASEGRFLAIVAAEQAEQAIARLRGEGDGQSRQAALIGTVSAHAGGPRRAGGAPAGAATTGGLVTLRSRLGTRRPLRLPQGEPLPRIC